MARRLLMEWWAVTLATLVLTLALVWSGTTARLDGLIYDRLVSLRAAPASDSILIVAIDDESIASLGQWPWRRDVHARAVDALAKRGAAAIGYDVLFTEPSRERGDDQALADAVRGAKVALPILFEAPGADGQPFNTVRPVEPLGSAATLGHVALPHDEDGKARTALLAVTNQILEWPHLAEQLYRLAKGAPSPAFLRGKAEGNMAVLTPYSQSGAFRTVSFVDLVSDRILADFVRGKMILIGATAGGLGDRHDVAGAGPLAGVEAQANLLNALLADRLVVDAPLPIRLSFGAVPALILMLMFWKLQPANAWIAAVALFAVTIATTVLLLPLTGIWLPPASALVGILFAYPLWGWRRLHMIDRAVVGELANLTQELGGSRGIQTAGLDQAGKNTFALSGSIAALRDLKRLVTDTVEGVADPLAVTAMDGEILVANQRAVELFAADTDVRARLYAAPDARDLITGDRRHFLHRRTPLRDASRSQRGWIHLFAEISQVRAVERDREEALEFLSHDMRAPQASIITLLDDAGNAIPDSVGARIAYHARKTLGLADNFVQLARLRDMRFTPAETDLHDCLAEASDALWPQANRKQVRIVTPDVDEPCCVAGERHALTRALLNLMDNALRYSPANSEIRCGIDEDQDSGRYLVWVEDTGPGVSPDRLADLTGRFGPLAASGPGLRVGLGLAYVRAVAERHGGSLSHAPAVPHGARFTLDLPAVPSARDH